MPKKVDTKALRDALANALPAIKSPENMKKIGQMAADMIRLRTRLGSGVSQDGAEKAKLKPLAPSTVKSRTDQKAKGKLSGNTTPKRSNLTATGQLLDSMQVTHVEYGSVSVGPKGSRNDGKTNEKIGEYVTDNGRPFNHLSGVELKRIQDSVKKDLRSRLKRALTKR